MQKADSGGIVAYTGFDQIYTGEKQGWPWGRELPEYPSKINGDEWPRISIITPSYNQGLYLEETIRSVLLQGYPNLEYIIMDGGSTDNSFEIIKKYEKHISCWEFGKDNGQSHAINKGFSRATGAIIAWLNSDDIYMEDSLRTVAEYFIAYRDCKMLVGAAAEIAMDGKYVGIANRLDSISTGDILYKWVPFPQPSVFWGKSVMDRLGVLREDLHYAMDREYFMRFWFNGVTPHFIGESVLSGERRYAAQKSKNKKVLFKEFAAVLEEYFDRYQGGRIRNIFKLFVYWRKQYYIHRGMRGLLARKKLSDAEVYGWRYLVKHDSVGDTDE